MFIFGLSLILIIVVWVFFNVLMFVDFFNGKPSYSCLMFLVKLYSPLLHIHSFSSLFFLVFYFTLIFSIPTSCIPVLYSYIVYSYLVYSYVVYSYIVCSYIVCSYILGNVS